MSDPAHESTKPKLSTDIPVGEILRRTRVHYKQSIQDIEVALRIRASQVEAIEKGDLSQLPGRVYAIGFVRSYSEFLGLDGDKMVELFKAQTAGKTHGPALQFPAAADETPLPSFWFAGGGLLIFLVLLSFWMMGGEAERAEVDSIPDAPSAQMPAPPMQANTEAPSTQTPPESATADTSNNTPDSAVAVEGTAGEVAASATLENSAMGVAEQEPEATIAEKPKEGIILNIVENSWVEIKDRTGKTVLSRVLSAGDEYFVPDRPDLTISLGNAGGVQFEVDGVSLRLLGETGQVKRSIPLDSAFLKKNYAR